LMKKGEGDTVRLETPGGEEEFEVIAVSYTARD
jgi:transcription elongation GreA/GreB family factor